MEAIIVIIILAGGGYAMYLFSRFGIEMLKDLYTTDDALAY